MLTLAQAELNKVYTVQAIQAEGFAKKHLNDLGFLPDAQVVVVNHSGDNGIIVLHNSRIAINQAILGQIIISEKEQTRGAWLPLNQLAVGEKGQVVGVHGQGAIKRRLMDMGLTKGTELLVRKVAPLGDPIEINLRGYELTLRKSEADLVLIEKEGV